MRAKTASKPFGRPAKAEAKPKVKHLTIRPSVFYLGFAVLALTNVLTLVGLLMSPDLTRLFSGQNDSILTAYEDRISELRLEVDRLQSRHYAQAGDINLQLQELAQTQELLIEQHQYVKQLADKAASLGIETAAAPDAGSAGTDVAPLATPSTSEGTDTDAGAEVAAATASVNKMMDDSRVALAALSDEANSKTYQIMGTLATLGIQPKLPDFAQDAEGGPLLPPVDGPEAPSLVDDANAVATALERYKSARAAADLAPVHKPIASATRISSIFGNRKDPFTGRLAFHSGIDFAAPQGSAVLSAGAGVVSFVGQISGYGNVVEILHSNGLITRYGHLSSFLVKEGQSVSTGTPIARVGSTGRSTGPHLHFEVRRADNAVDPARYLAAGRLLQRVLSS